MTMMVEDKDLGFVICELTSHGIKFECERFDQNKWIFKIKP